MNDKEVWVEVFGMPRYRRFENEDVDNIHRIYPNHVFIKVVVI